MSDPLYVRNGKIITQIGSLPFTDVDLAIRYSLRHDIPFLPELPKCGDGMFEYIKNPGKLSCLDEFKEAVEREDIPTVKVQCVGPATLVSNGYEENDAIYRVNEHVTAILDGLNVKEVILFLDEPSLGQVGFDYQKLWKPIIENQKSNSKIPIIYGVHCCGNMQWDRLLICQDISIVSFDASQYDITLYYKKKDRNRKNIAWGIRNDADIKDWKKGDLLTLPCGMGGLNIKEDRVYTEDDCIEALGFLREEAGKMISYEEPL